MSDDLELANRVRRVVADVDYDQHFLDQAADAIERLTAENKQLRADNERLLIDGIHTCHDQCQRVACVLRRERDAALADVERLRQALRILPFKEGFAEKVLRGEQG